MACSLSLDAASSACGCAGSRCVRRRADARDNRVRCPSPAEALDTIPAFALCVGSAVLPRWLRAAQRSLVCDLSSRRPTRAPLSERPGGAGRTGHGEPQRVLVVAGGDGARGGAAASGREHASRACYGASIGEHRSGTCCVHLPVSRVYGPLTRLVLCQKLLVVRSSDRLPRSKHLGTTVCTPPAVRCTAPEPEIERIRRSSRASRGALQRRLHQIATRPSRLGETAPLDRPARTSAHTKKGYLIASQPSTTSRAPPSSSPSLPGRPSGRQLLPDRKVEWTRWESDSRTHVGRGRP